MVSWPAPGPWIVRFLVRSSSPLVSVIVAGVLVVPPWCGLEELELDTVGEKTMVSPL